MGTRRARKQRVEPQVQQTVDDLLRPALQRLLPMIPAFREDKAEVLRIYQQASMRPTERAPRSNDDDWKIRMLEFFVERNKTGSWRDEDLPLLSQKWGVYFRPKFDEEGLVVGMGFDLLPVEYVRVASVDAELPFVVSIQVNVLAPRDEVLTQVSALLDRFPRKPPPVDGMAEAAGFWREAVRVLARELGGTRRGPSIDWDHAAKVWQLHLEDPQARTEVIAERILARHDAEIAPKFVRKYLKLAAIILRALQERPLALAASTRVEYWWSAANQHRRPEPVQERPDIIEWVDSEACDEEE